jgi:hypothetical protein
VLKHDAKSRRAQEAKLKPPGAGSRCFVNLAWGPQKLLAKAQSGYDLAVAFDVGLLQIVQQAATLPDELEEASPRVVVLLVDLEVFGQVANPVAQERDLHFR